MYSGIHVLNLVTKGIDKKNGQRVQWREVDALCELFLVSLDWFIRTTCKSYICLGGVLRAPAIEWAPGAVLFFGIFTWSNRNTKYIFFQNLIFSIKFDGKTSSPSPSNYLIFTCLWVFWAYFPSHIQRTEEAAQIHSDAE